MAGTLTPAERALDLRLALRCLASVLVAVPLGLWICAIPMAYAQLAWTLPLEALAVLSAVQAAWRGSRLARAAQARTLAGADPALQEAQQEVEALLGEPEALGAAIDALAAPTAPPAPSVAAPARCPHRFVGERTRESIDADLNPRWYVFAECTACGEEFSLEEYCRWLGDTCTCPDDQRAVRSGVESCRRCGRTWANWHDFGRYWEARQ